MNIFNQTSDRVKDSAKPQIQTERARAQSEIDRRFQDVNNPFTTPSVGLSGSYNEVMGRLDGLERARFLTGKSQQQIGEDYQDAFSNIKKRTELADTGSEMLRNSKAGAVANAKSQLQSQGVKGGAALKATSAVERQKSFDVNNQLQDAQRKAEMDYMNAAKANANFTQASEMNYGALAAGRDVKSPSSNSSGFGTVICTELFRQGYYDLETYQKDQEYGVKMMNEFPHIYWGYRAWADSVVWLMQRSTAFSAAVSVIALPWAEHMAGKENKIGKVISVVGEFACGLIGKLILRRLKYAN